MSATACGERLAWLAKAAPIVGIVEADKRGEGIVWCIICSPDAIEMCGSAFSLSENLL
jgi:hypothetical protein